MWKKKLRKLIANGHLRRLPAEEWSALTEEVCRRLCETALRNPPRMFGAPSLEQKNLIRSDLAQGLLPGLRSEDIAALTADEADILLAISAENRWNGQRQYGEIIRKETVDTMLATAEQIGRIRELIEAKRRASSPPTALCRKPERKSMD
ncbi:MAG: hypothetical protein IJH79_08470 [Lentisphaeria bacterium]|nr:hypothetical protein [Lentisphaeria bacterium]